MNTALWQAGWGYFLSNMIGTEAGLTRPDLEWARALPRPRAQLRPAAGLPVRRAALWPPAGDVTGSVATGP